MRCDKPVGEATQPLLDYPFELPVSARRPEIVDAIRDNQVVIVAGETGSGKTTQLPKMCLEAGRGRIAHTQPRRIAARAVAERLAEEMATPLGGFVGYRVRFTDQTAPDTVLTVMTDGILLASIRRDRMLQSYDTIIVDEAHERSLNIDFLLGYLAWLLPRRPDLKVVITSATLDTAALSEHFGGAPVIEVTGRTYPVEVRYRPQDDIDEVDAVRDAVGELVAEGPGDILVFLSGEREIRDTAEALAATVPRGTEIVPLFGRLSSAEQHRVFAPHDARRVVLATNVAETSLTVPGIHFVVDAGTSPGCWPPRARQLLEFLLGLYAFGALIGLTLAHVSIIRLRVRSPGLQRPYAVPLSVRIGKASVPIPAVVGALFAAAVWVSVVVTHPGARVVGTLWMVGGIAFYVAYRRLTSKPILRRVSVPREALMKEPEEIEYGTILVPVTGTPLDDDIMQTAGRLASEEGAEGDSSEPSQIEAVWFFEVPMSLPIDARLPDAETGRAREALDHAKRVGEEYEGVMVATAKMRTRSAGEGIVAEARRRGVQAIVLAAEEPSRIGGGARLGGSPSERFVGPTTRYVLANAHCPVILTAPARGERPVSSGTGD